MPDRIEPALDVLLTGDLILDEPDPDHWLSGIAPALKAASLAIGHLEVPHTHRGQESEDDVPAPAADPAHLGALRRAGFGAVTLAGNHMVDRGPEGVLDTIEGLEREGLAHCGAGRTLEEARRPATLQASGRRIAVLSYNCVGPESNWATATRAGCAYVRIGTEDGRPIVPSATLTQLDQASLAAMQGDVAQARGSADLLIVAFHKGIVHRPAVLASYERAVSQAAIEAGADVVIGHHAHILKGIEFYRNRPIFHGLGNGCVVTRALSPAQQHPRRAEWARRRRELFGFEPDPAYELAPFHPEAVHGMIARVRQHTSGTLETGFIPIHVDPPGRPVLASRAQAEQVRDYVADITVRAGLAPLHLRASDGGVTLRP